MFGFLRAKIHAFGTAHASALRRFGGESPLTRLFLGRSRESSVYHLGFYYAARAFHAARAGPFCHTTSRSNRIGANESLSTHRCEQPLEKQEMASFASPLQPLSNGATSIAADEELLYTLEDVRITAAPQEGDNAPWGAGRLRVTSRRVLWEQPAHGFELLAKRVGLHAVTRDAQTFPEPCLYVQLLLSDAAADDAVSELFLVPPDAAALEPLFDALSRTAELNPDSDDESDESDGGMLGIAGEEDEPDAEAMLRGSTPCSRTLRRLHFPASRASRGSSTTRRTTTAGGSTTCKFVFILVVRPWFLG